MAGEAVTAMIVADDAGDDPLADRREDREAAAERERKAKVAKLNSQTANAMEVVRAQQAAKERGAFDEAAIRANEVAGAPVKGTTAMYASIFEARLCRHPADTATTRWPAKASIFFGCHCCSSPCPSSPPPQEQTAPSADGARLKSCPRRQVRCTA